MTWLFFFKAMTQVAEKIRMRGLKVRQSFEVFLAIFFVHFLTACTRAEEQKSKLRFSIPAASTNLSAEDSFLKNKLASQSVSASTTWGQSDPASFDDFNCFAVMVGASDLAEASCKMIDSSLPLIKFGPRIGMIPRGKIVELEVPSGSQRTVYIVGFKSSAAQPCIDIQAQKIPMSDFATPQLIAAKVIDLAPGDVEVPISVKFPGDKIESCDGVNGDPISQPPPSDTVPRLAIADTSTTEGNVAQFTITLSNATTKDVVVSYAVNSEFTPGQGSVLATANLDYVASSGSLVIPAGSTQGTINVATISDSEVEGTEDFQVVLGLGSNFVLDQSKLVGIGRITSPSQLARVFSFNNAADYIVSNEIELSASGAFVKLAAHLDSSSWGAGNGYGTQIRSGRLSIDPSLNWNRWVDYSWLPNASNLVAHWRFDSNFADSLGSRVFTGTGASIATGQGQSGAGSLSVSSTSSYLSLPYSSALDTSAFTLMMWVRPSGTFNIVKTILSRNGIKLFTYASTGLWGAEIDQNTFGANTVVLNSFSSGSKARLGEWSHLALSAGPTGLFLYVNGELVAESPAAYVKKASSDAFVIGDTSFPREGHFDDLMAFSSALPRDHIYQIFNRGRAKLYAQYQSPIFDGGSNSYSWNSLSVYTDRPYLKELTSTNENSAEYIGLLTPNLVLNQTALFHLNSSLSNSIAGGSDATSGASFTDGVFRGGLNLASGAYLSLPTNAFGSLDQTVSFWFKSSDKSSAVQKLLYFSDGRFDLSFAAADSTLHYKFGLAQALSSITVDTSAPIHVLMARDESAHLGYFYINGVLASVSPTDAPGTLSYAKFGYPSGIRAVIDEIAIWNRKLALSEVLGLYLRGGNRVQYQVRACTDPACSTGSWRAWFDNSNSWLSEIRNNSNIDAGGAILGDPLADHSIFSFSNFLANSAFVGRRYFQMRFLLESDDIGNSCDYGSGPAACVPEVLKGGTPGQYNMNGQTVQLQVPAAYGKIVSFEASGVNPSCSKWVFSADGGASWKYYNVGLSSWDNVVSPGDVNTNSQFGIINWSVFPTNGNFKFKVFLDSDGSQECGVAHAELVTEP